MNNLPSVASAIASTTALFPSVFSSHTTPSLTVFTTVVSISEEPESIEPLQASEEASRPKQFKASMADKRLTGRPNYPSNSSSRLSLISQTSLDEPLPTSDTSGTPRKAESHPHGHHSLHGHRSHHQHRHDKLLSQVAEWLHAEKAKRTARKAKRRENAPPQDAEEKAASGRPRTASQGSDSSALSLDQLQRILEDSMTSFAHEQPPLISPNLGPRQSPTISARRSSYVPSRRRPSLKKLGGGSSDTEYQDGDVVVPSCDVMLDNSKTMSYSGGVADSAATTVTLSTSKRAEKERKAWLTFKCEIVRLAHTLRLKGWRRVPLDRGGDIEVERLSGALTNAVYVVSPPKDLPQSEALNSTTKPHHHKPPPRLLLRIYGPQVEHLIDRENELSILRRLARKKIGPRLLGTFTNGRFEEFFNAQTLRAEDLRVEDTFKQIAKRMRELHDGIDLLDRERDEGPFVWRNWDKWVDRCEEVISYLDNEILSGKKVKGELWRSRGFVCGVEWPQFRAAIEKYRKWLNEYYGAGGLNRKLVFAHNDTQYGNILRLIPEQPMDGSSPSPLLMPQNTHKQLVVIDFEYASANTPGLEFANHFTEWCYNYHDPEKSWACNTKNYPTVEQQTRFLRSYVNHRPQFNPRASATPKMNPMDPTSRGSIGEFLLDSRTPGGSNLDLGASMYDYKAEEALLEKHTERQVQELMQEARIWRVANSAQWVAWGIVQAKVPGLDAETILPEAALSEEPEPIIDGEESIKRIEATDDKRPEGLKAEALLAGGSPKEAESLEDEEDEFDYLAYAQDRARFFWGDLVGLGIVDKKDLPTSLIEKLKIVDH